MDAITAEFQSKTLSIVVLGRFNPAIFQPQWYAVNNLIARQIADTAQITTIQNNLALFSIGGVRVLADDDRLGLTTIESPDGTLLHELMVGTLSILEHTPIRAIGFNSDFVFDVGSEETWHQIGHTLAPKDAWLTALDEPGLRQLIVHGKRRDCSADRIQIRIEPGPLPKVIVALNQHYELADESETDTLVRNERALRALNDDWHSFCHYADEAASELIASTARAGKEAKDGSPA